MEIVYIQLKQVKDLRMTNVVLGVLDEVKGGGGGGGCVCVGGGLVD